MTKRRKLPPGMRELPSGSVRWEKMVDGRRFSGTAKTITEARAAQAACLTDVQRGGAVDPSRVTVAEYLTEWLDRRAGSRAIRTTAIQRGHLDRYIKPQIGDLRLQKLAPVHLRRLFDHLNTCGLGASSQRQLHQFLISALGEAFRLELVTRNVAEIVRPTPPRAAEERELPAFTPEEAAKFVEAARTENSTWARLFLFALGTGLRRGELVGLRWSDVDLERGTAQVCEVIASNKGGPITTTPKTVGSRRTVYLSPSALTLLAEQQKAQELTRTLLKQPVRGHAKTYKRKRPWAGGERVFTNLHGDTLYPGALSRELDRLCAAAGVRRLTVHGLRHTYASLSLMRGVPIEVVSKQLGHSSPAFTLARYRWVFKSERQAWALGLDQLTGTG